MKFLYEQLKGKVSVLKLPLELAYSLPYLVKVDRTIGSEIVTFKEVKVNKN